MNIFFSTLSIPAFALLCSWSDKDGLEENLVRLLEQRARNLKQQSESLRDQTPDFGEGSGRARGYEHSFKQFHAARGTTTADAVSRSGVTAQ